MYNVNWFESLKLSMYFTYTSAQNYMRTLTQGVNITDNRKLTADYKRANAQNVNGITDIKKTISFFRQCVDSVVNLLKTERLPLYTRTVFDYTKISSELHNNRELFRNFDESVIADSVMNRQQGLVRKITEYIKGTDYISFPVVFVRTVNETQGATDTILQWGDYIRRLIVEAGSSTETIRQSDYHRFNIDTVQADGSVFRGLLIFVKIMTTSIVRDFILRRFLVAREELVLKSSITTDLTPESKIN
jgi:hypothetical protein